VDVCDGVATIRRNIGHGWEIVEAKTPLLITVIATANQPRPCGARKVMRYKKARIPGEIAAEVKAAMNGAAEAEVQAEVERRQQALASQGLLIEQWDLDTIHADLNRCGLAGSPTKVYRVQSIVLTKEGYSEVPPSEDGVRQLIHELVIDRTLG
jgi:electron transfer flavoprotein beta subunit